MIFNVTGGGAGMSGATLIVTAPALCTVTVSKDGKSKTKTAGTDGMAVFKGLATGEWTVTITDGSQMASKVVSVTADYATSITFFSATINVTYPAGSTCTATDGVTTLSAPDTTGSCTFTVPNTGTWTVTATDGSRTTSKTVSITTDGQNETVGLSYRLYIIENGIYNRTYGFSGQMRSGSTVKITENPAGYLYLDCGKEVGNGITTSVKLDVSAYSKLVCDIQLTAYDADYNWVGLATTLNNSSGAEVTDAMPYKSKIVAQTSSKQTVTLDVSSANGSYYIGLIFMRLYANLTAANVYNLYLD